MTTRDPQELLREVLGRIERATGLVPKAAGGQWQCRCPAHKDVGPSLSVSAGDKGIVFKCFAGCEASAIVAALGMELGELFYERRTRIERPTFSDALAEWCWHRGVTRRAALDFGVEVDGPCIRAPMRNSRGAIIGWQRRRGDNGTFALPAGAAKTYTEPGGKNGVFRVEPWPTDGRVYIAEGLPDAVAARSAGGGAVIGTPGAAAPRRCIRAIQRLCAGRELVLFPHGDAAGRRWRDRIGAACADAGCSVRFVVPEDELDLNDRLRRVS